jgi:hypothetical protein
MQWLRDEVSRRRETRSFRRGSGGGGAQSLGEVRVKVEGSRIAHHHSSSRNAERASSLNPAAAEPKLATTSSNDDDEGESIQPMIVL